MRCAYEREPCIEEATVTVFGKGYCSHHIGLVYGARFLNRLFEAWKAA